MYNLIFLDYFLILFVENKSFNGDWGLGIGDWGLGMYSVHFNLFN